MGWGNLVGEIPYLHEALVCRLSVLRVLTATCRGAY